MVKDEKIEFDKLWKMIKKWQKKEIWQKIIKNDINIKNGNQN